MSEKGSSETLTPAQGSAGPGAAGAFRQFLHGLDAEHRLSALAKKAIPLLASLARIDWAAINQRLDELPEKSKATMMLALSKGWFFGWHDGLQSLMELVEKLGVAQLKDVDWVMAEYYRTNLQPFTDEMVIKYPDRAPIIKAAVNAYLTLGCDGYLLCIPVFIAQADGLLTEITKVKSATMTDRKTHELQASKALREKLGTDQEALDLLYPILNLHASDFMKSAEARKLAVQASGEIFTALNRHQVMHGEALDYGTEINSLTHLIHGHSRDSLAGMVQYADIVY